jgi:hypothetical protein
MAPQPGARPQGDCKFAESLGATGGSTLSASPRAKQAAAARARRPQAPTTSALPNPSNRPTSVCRLCRGQAGTPKFGHSRNQSCHRTVRAKKGKRRELEAGAAVDPREAKRKRQATANRMLAPLKAALNLAWKAGKVAGDPVWKRVDPYKGADQPRARYLTTAEATRLVNASAPDFRPLAHAAILTACRWGELRSTRVRDYDPASETVAVTFGWHTLSVHVAGGGVRAGDALLRFGGRAYPANPSLVPIAKPGDLNGSIPLKPSR